MRTRLGLASAVLATATLLSACGGFGAGSADPTPTDASSTPAATTATTRNPGPSASTSARPNDLPDGRASRTVREGSLTVSADYSTSLPIDRWTPAITKPLRISMTAFTAGAKDQKIYLSRVTIYPSSADDQGELGSIDPIVDTSPLTPGYLVTFPDQYGWRIVIPGMNASSRTVSLDIRYEFLLYQGGSSPRDYSKQTVTDTLTVPLQ